MNNLGNDAIRLQLRWIRDRKFLWYFIAISGSYFSSSGKYRSTQSRSSPESSSSRRKSASRKSPLELTMMWHLGAASSNLPNALKNASF
jgi:hypothetical protein